MLALTMGDPAGIGGEITMQAWSALRASGPAFVALADPKCLGPRVKIVASPAEAAGCFREALPVMPVRLATPARAGRPDPVNAAATIASIERAVELTLAGQTTAVVTNPISKSTLYAAGFAYPGHTEFLAAMTGGARPVMMLASTELCVVPVTIHVALREALDKLTGEAIIETARTTHAAMQRDFAIARPRLAVAGLNPHAGEGGAMGYEEIRVIAPAIATLQAEGIDATGPYPPDTLFTAKARPNYDAAICMYHDQALIPLKTLAMDRGVNVTLGLPIVRTSPDHGTAFDIAGTGRADPASLIAALRLAAELVSRRGRAS